MYCSLNAWIVTSIPGYIPDFVEKAFNNLNLGTKIASLNTWVVFKITLTDDKTYSVDTNP